MFYSLSHNHGSVENYPNLKVTILLEIHPFSTEPWSYGRVRVSRIQPLFSGLLDSKMPMIWYTLLDVSCLVCACVAFCSHVFFFVILNHSFAVGILVMGMPPFCYATIYSVSNLKPEEKNINFLEKPATPCTTWLRSLRRFATAC